MELLPLCRAVAEQLDRLDFSSLYPGYHRFPFALYNEEQVCLEGRMIPWDNRFLGNTSIEYEGQRIAIWNVALDPQPPVALAASMVHEMFHCYQFEQGESRFPDDLRLLHIPTEPTFYLLKLAENRALAAACRTGDSAEWERFAALRNARAQKFPDAAAEEWKAETVEGTAETMCLRALRVLDPAQYTATLDGYLAKLEDDLLLLLDARRLCYYTGTVLCLTLERLHRPLYTSFRGLPCMSKTARPMPSVLKLWRSRRWRPFLPSTSKNSRPPWQPTGRLAHSTPAKPRSAATIP